MLSFGSNYRFNIGRNFPYEVMDEIENCRNKDIIVNEKHTPFEEAAKTGVFANVTVSSPNCFDGKIEAILLSRGIDFRRQTFEEALDLDNIKNRIQLSEDDFYYGNRLINIDTKILDNLFKEDGISYIEPYGKNGISNRYKGVGEYLKTGEKIDATKVCFMEQDGKLAASINDGRHRFAYMRDLGMKEIPVSVDKNSYEIAKKYGLI